MWAAGTHPLGRPESRAAAAAAARARRGKPNVQVAAWHAALSPEQKRAKLSKMMAGNSRSARGSSAERRLADWLATQGIAFKQQWPFSYVRNGKACNGFADFYLPGPKLVIECDGYFHHRDADARLRDSARDRSLAAAGINVLRVNSKDVARDPASVASQVRALCCFAWLSPKRVSTHVVGHQSVHNIEVEEDHSYVVAGMAVHNCEPLDDVTARMDEPFPGGYMHPPAHPRCRCTTTLVPPSALAQDERADALGEARDLIERQLGAWGAAGRELTASELKALPKLLAQRLSAKSLETLKRCSADICPTSGERYTLNLFDGRNASVYLLRWGEGQAADWHDHGPDTKVGIHVLRDAPVENIFLSTQNEVRTLTLQPGGSYFLPGFYVHRVADAKDGQVSWSIHVYSGPNGGLDQMRFYKTDGAGRIVLENGEPVVVGEWKRGQKGGGCCARTRAAAPCGTGQEVVGPVIHVHLPTAPDVQVTVPEREVHVHMPPDAPKVRRIRRDAAGQIVEIAEEPQA